MTKEEFERMAQENRITKAPAPAPKLPNSYVPDPAVVARVAAMSDLEKADMRKDIERKRVPVQDYRPVKPDPKHWLLEDDWEIDEGAILVVDLDPGEGLGKQFKTLLRPDMGDSMATASLKTEELATFRNVQTIIRRATAVNSTLRKTSKLICEDITGYRELWIATPAGFMEWVQERLPVGVNLPEWMLPKNAVALPVGVSSGAAAGLEAKPELEDIAQKPPSEAMIEKMLGVYNDLDSPSMTKVADLTGFDRGSKQYKAAWKEVIKRVKAGR